MTELPLTLPAGTTAGMAALAFGAIAVYQGFRVLGEWVSYVIRGKEAREAHERSTAATCEPEKIREVVRDAITEQMERIITALSGFKAPTIETINRTHGHAQAAHELLEEVATKLAVLLDRTNRGT